MAPEDTIPASLPGPGPGRSPGPAPAAPPPAASAWLPWLGWLWVAILLLAAAAEAFDLAGLRLALDFQRHLR